jgi:tetratricopeptide (TPR) repeat protein
VKQGKAHVAAGDEAQLEGDIEEFKEEYRAAVEDFSSAIELAPELAEAYVERGHAVMYLENYQEAIRDLTVAVELDPDLADAWSWRALAYADLAENDKAISDADRAISLNYELPWAHAARGIALMNKGEFEEAIASFTSAIDLAPYVLFLVNRSNCYLNLGNNQAAYDDATLAIEASPSFAMAYNNRGVALLNVLRYADALSDFDTALSIEPGTPLYLANCAFASWGLGDARRAVRHAEEAVAGDPDSGRNFVIRAAAYELNDRLDEAMLDLDRAESRGAKDSMFYLIRGNIKFKQGQLDAALADYDQAIAMSPNWPMLYEQRGNCYMAKGRPNEAAQDFAYAQQLLGN